MPNFLAILLLQEIIDACTLPFFLTKFLFSLGHCGMELPLCYEAGVRLLFLEKNSKYEFRGERGCYSQLGQSHVKLLEKNPF